jgi:hypothetical protein
MIDNTQLILTDIDASDASDDEHPTKPTALETDLLNHISLLYDGNVTQAMRNVVLAPVRAQVRTGDFTVYPSPTEAWQHDPAFRQWVLEIADHLYRRSGRFNIISFLNLITKYDDGHHCFVRWYYGMWCRRKVGTSWTIQQIRRARLFTH